MALTDKGRRVTDQMLPAHAADIEDILSFMPRAALGELSELLGRLRDGLHAHAERRGTALCGGVGWLTGPDGAIMMRVV